MSPDPRHVRSPPKADIAFQIALSYNLRLCQPLFRLIDTTHRAYSQDRKAAVVGLTFTELWMLIDGVVNGPNPGAIAGNP